MFEVVLCLLSAGTQRLQRQFVVILTAMSPTQSCFLLMEQLGGDFSTRIFLLKLWAIFLFACTQNQHTVSQYLLENSAGNRD